MRYDGGMTKTPVTVTRTYRVLGLFTVVVSHHYPNGLTKRAAARAARDAWKVSR